MLAELDGRSVFDGLVSARQNERSGERTAEVDAWQLARDVLLSEQEFRRAGEYLSGSAAVREGRDVGLEDWAKGLGWGALAVASVTPWGGIGKFGRAARMGEEAWEAGRALEAATDAVNLKRLRQYAGPVDSFGEASPVFRQVSRYGYPETFEPVNAPWDKVYTRTTTQLDEVFGPGYVPSGLEERTVGTRSVGLVLDSDFLNGRERFFHGTTSADNVEDIISGGLRASRSGDYGEGVYGTTSLKSALSYGTKRAGIGAPNWSPELADEATRSAREDLRYVFEFVSDRQDVEDLTRIPRSGIGYALISGDVPAERIAAVHVFEPTGGGNFRLVDSRVLNRQFGSALEDYGILPRLDAKWDIPEGADDLSRSVFEFQREAGAPFGEALAAANRTRAAEAAGEKARETTRRLDKIMGLAPIREGADWSIPSDLDEFTRSMLELQRQSGMTADRAYEAVNRARVAEGLPEITPLMRFDEQYPENIGQALTPPAYLEGAPPAGVSQAEINERIVQGSLELQADPLVANRLFGTELGRQLEEILPVDDLIDDYAMLEGPAYRPLGVSRALEVDEETKKVKGAAKGAPRDVLDTPLRRMGLEPNPDFLNSERALAFYAQEYKKATSKSDKLLVRQRFVDEIARTLSNQGRFMTTNSRGRPVFYVERQQAVDSIAARTGFNRNVIAAASAAASQQAPPMEEAFRLFMVAPFIKMEGGRAVFDVAGFRDMFRWGDIKDVRKARQGLQDFPRNKEGEYKIQTFMESAGHALADLINNPDFLNRTVRGIGHKTSPYAILALDGLNPYAVVADTNYWYVIAANKALGKKILTRKSLSEFARMSPQRQAQATFGATDVQNIPGAMSSGLIGSAMPAAQTRALAAAAGPLATPSSVQADIWFPLRNILDGAQDDAFFMPGEGANAVRTGLINILEDRLVGNNAAAKRYKKALSELLEGGGKSWEDMMVAALNNVGSAFGPQNGQRIRNLSARAYTQFANEVGAGNEFWTRVVRNGEDVIIANPTNWRATLAYGDRVTPAGRAVESLEVLQRVTERVTETLVPFLRGTSRAVVFAIAMNQASKYLQDPEQQRQVAEEVAGMTDA